MQRAARLAIYMCNLDWMKHCATLACPHDRDLPVSEQAVRGRRAVQRHCRTCNDEDGSLCYQNQRGRLSAETNVMPYVMR